MPQFTRSTVATDSITQLPDKPNISAALLKAKFDAYGVGDKPYINDTLLVELEANTVIGSDGASKIGLKLAQITATNVTGAILEIYNSISAIVLGQIPNNSLTDIKLGTDVKVGSLALLNTTVKTDVVSAINEVEATAEGSIQKSIVDAAGDLIKGTGADTVARLPRGTANQVLAVNSGGTDIAWTTLTTDDGAWKKIAEVNPSAVTSIDFTSIPTTYDFFKIVWHGESAGATGSNLNIRFNSDTATNYAIAGIAVSAGGTSVATLNTSTSITSGLLAYNGGYSGGTIEISNKQTENKSVVSNCNSQFDATTPYMVTGGGVWKNNSSKITTLTLLCSNAITGRFELWGAL